MEPVERSGLPREYGKRLSGDGTKADFSGLELQAVPEFIENLAGLAELNLSHNRLTALPSWISNLTHLATLQVSSNNIARLPYSLGNLKELEVLEVNANQLLRLPTSLGGLAKLTSLELRENRITAIPASLGNLTNLTKMDLSANRITELPPQLAEILTEKFTLLIEGNPLRQPLPEMARQGSRPLGAYLRSLDGAEPLYEAKLLLVGEGNVGKSSLVAALRGEVFVEGRPTTHGIEVSNIDFKHPELDLTIALRAWDFGGQEVYRISHQFFFSPRALYLAVWHSRQGQEQDDVEGWLRRIRLRVGAGTVALVVATHCNERLPDLDYQHLVKSFPGMLAGAFNIDSSTGDGIDRLRQAIAVQAAKLPQMGQMISARWTAVREEVLALAKTEPQIRYKRFSQICREHHVEGDEIGTLAKLMHDLGLVIYYDRDEGLRDVVVLNPEWLTRAISYVLDDRGTANAGGVLDHARLQAIWQNRANGYPARYHPYFLRLMEKFDISYRLPDDDTRSLIPQLVPHERPVLPWQFGGEPSRSLRSLTLTCRMSESAPGLISWLTVRHHRASIGKHWRRGVFLRHPTEAYRSEAVLEMVNDNELVLEVRAPSPDLYFNVLRDSIEDLISIRWPGLKYYIFVPCPGKNGSPCPGQFRLDGLLKVREKGQLGTYPCADCGELYDIAALLTGFSRPDRPISAEIELVNSQLAEIKSDLRGLRGQAAGIADTVRRIHQIIGTEVDNCPRLFTLARRHPDPSTRLRFYEGHYRLTLWCEHPGHEHACDDATYDLDTPKGWFTRIAPYARLVVRILQLVVPVAAALDIAALPTSQRDNAQIRLDVMKTIIEELPSGDRELDGEQFTSRNGGSSSLTQAEGRALRALRQIVFEKDPIQAFGGLRRCESPSGDLLWVCPLHYPEYDPGLPELPNSAS